MGTHGWKSHTCVHNEGLSWKWKERLILSCRFCSCLQVWNTINWSLRNDIRAIAYNVLFFPRIQAGHWRDSCAFLRFSLLGSTRCYGVFPRQLPAAPMICPTGTLFVKQMEFPSKRYFLLCMFALKIWVLVSTGDQEKREVPDCCVRNERQSKTE